MRNQLFKTQITSKTPTDYICDIFGQAIGKQNILVLNSKQ